MPGLLASWSKACKVIVHDTIGMGLGFKVVTLRVMTLRVMTLRVMTLR